MWAGFMGKRNGGRCISCANVWGLRRAMQLRPRIGKRWLRVGSGNLAATLAQLLAITELDDHGNTFAPTRSGISRRLGQQHQPGRCAGARVLRSADGAGKPVHLEPHGAALWEEIAGY